MTVDYPIHEFDIAKLLSQFRQSKDVEVRRLFDPLSDITKDLTQTPPMPVHTISQSENSQTDAPAETPKLSAFDKLIAFAVKLRGYDKDQVDKNINDLTDDYDSVCEQRDALERENEALRKILAVKDNAIKTSHSYILK